MNSPSPITIIDDKKLRGILAPKGLLTKKLMEDILDLIELAAPREIKKANQRINEADRQKTWIPLDKVVLKARKAV